MFNYFKNRPTPEDIAKALFLSDMLSANQNVVTNCISILPNSIEREQEMEFLRWMNEVQQSEINDKDQRRLNNDG